MSKNTMIDKIIWSEKTGTEFEQDAIFYLGTVLKDKIKNKTATKSDIDEGTDAIYTATETPLRLDFTLNFASKDNMPFIRETNIPATEIDNFKMGIRIGNTHNGHTSFEEPVVVIGLDLDKYREHDNIIIQNIKNNAELLMLDALDCYLDYTATTEEERAAVFNNDLKSNPNYNEHPKTTDKFKNLNKLRHMVEKEQLESTLNDDSKINENDKENISK